MTETFIVNVGIHVSVNERMVDVNYMDQSTNSNLPVTG